MLFDMLSRLSHQTHSLPSQACCLRFCLLPQQVIARLNGHSSGRSSLRLGLAIEFFPEERWLSSLHSWMQSQNDARSGVPFCWCFISQLFYFLLCHILISFWPAQLLIYQPADLKAFSLPTRSLSIIMCTRRVYSELHRC